MVVLNVYGDGETMLDMTVLSFLCHHLEGFYVLCSPFGIGIPNLESEKGVVFLMIP
jgi:hypothetical protein